MNTSNSKNKTEIPVRKTVLVRMKLLMKSKVSGLKLSNVINELFPLLGLIGLGILSYCMTVAMVCADMGITFSEFIEKLPSIIEFIQHPVSLEEYIKNQSSCR